MWLSLVTRDLHPKSGSCCLRKMTVRLIVKPSNNVLKFSKNSWYHCEVIMQVCLMSEVILRMSNVSIVCANIHKQSSNYQHSLESAWIVRSVRRSQALWSFKSRKSRRMRRTWFCHGGHLKTSRRISQATYRPNSRSIPILCTIVSSYADICVAYGSCVSDSMDIIYPHHTMYCSIHRSKESVVRFQPRTCRELSLQAASALTCSTPYAGAVWPLQRSCCLPSCQRPTASVHDAMVHTSTPT